MFNGVVFQIIFNMMKMIKTVMVMVMMNVQITKDVIDEVWFLFYNSELSLYISWIPLPYINHLGVILEG